MITHGRDYDLEIYLDDNQEKKAQSTSDVIKFICVDYLDELSGDFFELVRKIQNRHAVCAPKHIQPHQHFGLSILEMAYQTYKMNAQNAMKYIDWVNNKGGFPQSYEDFYGGLKEHRYLHDFERAQEKARDTAMKNAIALDTDEGLFPEQLAEREKARAKGAGEVAFKEWQNKQILKILESPVFQQIMDYMTGYYEH
ncbi:MAG: hypothetical protein FWC00_04615 [Firmicutes bacterium]|nr:hypothetical protein [Bacillota bacterium]